jgi:hypothetical protein
MIIDNFSIRYKIYIYLLSKQLHIESNMKKNHIIQLVY